MKDCQLAAVHSPSEENLIQNIFLSAEQLTKGKLFRQFLGIFSNVGNIEAFSQGKYAYKI